MYSMASTPEVGIYKRKQEIKQQELDQESDQENKETRKKARTRPRKRPRKKEKTFFFLDHFLGRVIVFLFSYFLVLF